MKGKEIIRDLKIHYALKGIYTRQKTNRAKKKGEPLTYPNIVWDTYVVFCRLKMGDIKIEKR